MRHAAILFCLTLSLAIFPAYGGDRLPSEVINFLQSRKVLATIEFAEGESRLSKSAMKTIDQVADKLKQLDPTKTLVRVEGVASRGGGEQVNIPISMSRARAVVDYLKENYSVPVDLSLTGFGSASMGSLALEPGCHADIAFYDNPWEIPGLKVEKVASK